MPAPSEMGGAGTTGHAPIPEEEEDDEEVDEAGVEAKVTVLYLMLLVVEGKYNSFYLEWKNYFSSQGSFIHLSSSVAEPNLFRARSRAVDPPSFFVDPDPAVF